MSRELMQQALEALNHVNVQDRVQIITALRQALETKYKQARSLTDELMDCVDRLGSEADTVDPRVWQHLLVYAPKHEEEPVAWISESGNLLSWDKFYDHMKPLYTAPQKKEWVGLTEEDLFDIAIVNFGEPDLQLFIEMGKLVQEELKEKNT